MDNQLAPKLGMSAVGSLSAGLEASSLHPMVADEGILQVILTARTNCTGWDSEPLGGLPTSLRILKAPRSATGVARSSVQAGRRL